MNLKPEFAALLEEVREIIPPDSQIDGPTCGRCGAQCWIRFGRHSNGFKVWHPSGECPHSKNEHSYRATEEEALVEFCDVIAK